jgi:hypothetical protein
MYVFIKSTLFLPHYPFMCCYYVFLQLVLQKVLQVYTKLKLLLLTIPDYIKDILVGVLFGDGHIVRLLVILDWSMHRLQ